MKRGREGTATPLCSLCSEKGGRGREAQFSDGYLLAFWGVGSLSAAAAAKEQRETGGIKKGISLAKWTAREKSRQHLN